MGKIIGLVFNEPTNPEIPEISDQGAVAPVDTAAEVDYICPVCGKTYRTQAGLDKHMAEKHLTEKHLTEA